MCACAAIALALCACSGDRTGAIPSGAVPSARSLVVTSTDFVRIAAWGAKGSLARAACPRDYNVVAGGSSSSNGSAVGAGYANTNKTQWIVKPIGSASAEAFATCTPRKIYREVFRWRYGTPTSGVAAAQCRQNFDLITGFSGGTATATWFDPSTQTFWVTGGATAYASCARSDAGIIMKHAWNKSQKPKVVYAGCGSGYTDIGGSMGDSQWPGPPLQEHPGNEQNPGKHGNDGWWTFTNALNDLTWAACVKT
jgi:hypothetical protein